MLLNQAKDWLSDILNDGEWRSLQNGWYDLSPSTIAGLPTNPPVVFVLEKK
jgi:hypothetical protein